MDRTDYKILNILQADSRTTLKDIGDHVGLTAPAVSERIRKMEASGLIERHTTIINNQKAGKDVTALLQVALEHPRYNDDFRAVVQDNREVLECYFVTGEFDYLLKVVTGNTESLERLLNTIKSIPGVQRTLTSVVMSSVKFQPSVSPDELTLKERR